MATLSRFEKVRERSSNFELLRILCMFAIISDHVFQGSPIIFGTGFFSDFFYRALPTFSRISCTVFVMIGAYFLVDSKFKSERIFRLAFAVIFYDLILTFGMHMFVGIPPRIFVEVFFPVTSQHLWFVSAYIVLLCLSPLLNFLINNFTKQGYITILICYGLLLFVGPTILANCGFWRPEIFTLVYAYFFAGYLKRYQIECLNHPYNALLLAISFPAIRLLFFLFWDNNHSIPFGQYIAHYLETYRMMLPMLPNFVSAVGVFCLFRLFKIKQSKIINSIAATVLGVYIIHQVPVFYTTLWNGIFNAKAYAGGGLQVVYTLFMIVCTFSATSIVEYLRQRFVSPLLEGSNFAKTFYAKLDNYINRNLFIGRS